MRGFAFLAVGAFVSVSGGEGQVQVGELPAPDIDHQRLALSFLISFLRDYFWLFPMVTELYGEFWEKTDVEENDLENLDRVEKKEGRNRKLGSGSEDSRQPIAVSLDSRFVSITCWFVLGLIQVKGSVLIAFTRTKSS